ncbi:hypothetical protein PR048_031307 [Dryococelus australis]|uniref:AAA+ ATPase domain-containing protein n=1 Tax=Dryococelus australis TaxID=614101 RepID=A0ABQ9G4W3_9NEOP|nr:hypothetical protein PR048_031307 [Dryococelus australis]
MEKQFQQDGAPSHNVRISMNVVNALFPGRNISQDGDIAWHPRSRHLTACDFLWGHTKTEIRGICVRITVREQLKELTKQYDKSENDLKALQSVGQATNGPRYVVGCRRQLDKAKLKSGTRVALDMTTLTIMRYLPREVDPLVYNMSHEDPGDVTYSAIGGLSEQIRGCVIELPLLNPELFQRVGITPPKGCLLYGPPGTGKTLLARAVASQLDANFLKVVSSAIVDKYIGESARLIREMFNYARDHQPCIIFMDEIDAIGGRRFSEGTSADREIQRTLMELLNQMDGFDSLGQVKMIMATNRPDTLDPALLRPGRLDRKIEIPLPNEQARLEILKIHAGPIAKHGEMGWFFHILMQ